MPQPQTYTNHARLVPLYLAALAVLSINAAWSLYDLTAGLSAMAIRAAVVSMSLVVLAIYARGFALRAQDRIIRLEMRLRLREVLPAGLHPRIHDFTHDQLIALRFASDRELPDLAARILRDDIRDRKAIKQLVADWQADHMRV